jgi:hypothetical protein
MIDAFNPRPFNVSTRAGFGSPDSSFRVYPAAGGLFFVVVSLDSKTTLQLAGGLIGVIVAKILENSNMSKREQYIMELDSMATLKERMETNRYNFRIPFDEILGSRFEKFRLDLRTNSSRTKARWTLRYRDEGKTKLRYAFFTSNDDIAAAIPLLESTLGDRHQTLIEWNEKKQKYVKMKKRKKPEPGTIDVQVDEDEP